MPRPQRRSGGRTTPKGTRPRQRARADRDPSSEELLLRDADWTLDQSPDEIDSFVSTVAILVAPDDDRGRPVFEPVRLLRACEHAGDRSGLLVAKAVELLGPVHVRGAATQVIETLRASVPPEDRERIEAIGRVEPFEAFALTDGHHDATALYLRARRPSGEEVTVRVSCEAGFRGAATVFGYRAAALQDRDRATQDPRMIVEEVSTADVRVWFDHAVAARDEDFFPDPDDMDEQLAIEHRPIVTHYFHQCPEGGRLPARARPTGADEVPALVAEFVASPFATGLDDAFAIAQALAEFGLAVSGRPLWWSPMVAEIFAQYAGEVFGPGAMRSMAPTIEAWASWAGERLGKTSAAIDETRRAIDRFSTSRDRVEHDDLLVLPGLELAGIEDDEDEDWLIAAWTKHAAHVAEFVKDGLAELQGAAPPTLEGLAESIRDGVAAQGWPYSALAAMSRATSRRLTDLADAEVVLWAASVMLDPDPDLDDLAGDVEDELLDLLALAGSLDPIDWATVTVALGRAGPGAPCTPEALLGLMEELRQDPTDDADVLESCFEASLPLWRAAGVTDADDRLTEVGAWAVPRAMCRALGTEFDEA